MHTFNIKTRLLSVFWLLISFCFQQSFTSNEKHEQCGAHCYKLFKPVLLDTVEFRQQIEEYREKYHDVGGKMERMQQNLTRQDILIDYQTEQIARLNIELDKYKDSVRIKDSQINTLFSEIKENNYKQKIENEKNDNKIRSLESEIEDLRKQNKIAQEQRRSQVEQLKSELQIETENKEIKVKSLESLNKRSETENVKKDKEIQDLKSKLIEKNNLLVDCKNNITLLINRTETGIAELNMKDIEITSLRSDVELKDSQISKFKNKIEKCSAESCLPFGNSTDLQPIRIAGMAPFVAPCDSQIAGPGWMVMQRRIDGSVDFNRTWHDYKHGFGNVSGDFWLGLERVHKLTTSRRYELYVQVTNMTDHVLNSRFDQFEIGSEEEQYKLKSLGKWTGTKYNSLIGHVGRKFSTLDRDNDEDDKYNNFAITEGAWWHRNDDIYRLVNCYYFMSDNFQSFIVLLS